MDKTTYLTIKDQMKQHLSQLSLLFEMYLGIIEFQDIPREWIAY